MGSLCGVIDWLSVQFSEERSRWFLWFPVIFASGIAVYFNLTWQPSHLSLGLTALIGGFLSIPALRKPQFLFLGLLILLFFSAGFNAALIRQLSIEAPVLQKKAVTELSGLVIHKSSGAKKTKLLIRDPEIVKDGVAKLSKLTVSVRADISHIKPGQYVSLKAVLYPPPPPAYPGAYDFQRSSYFREIGAVGYSISSIKVIDRQTGLWFRIKTLSAELRTIINTYIHRNAQADTVGFSTAIMTGDKSALPKEQLENMRQSGLAHLLAISGLHMGMVGGLIFFTVRLAASCWPRITLYYPTKKGAAMMALIGLTGYLFVSGMSVSALRAYLMISMIFSAICFDRTALSMRNLALAAFVILVLLPESLLTASFQMSFAAVFCLIAVYERFGRQLLTSSHRTGVVRRLILSVCGIVFTSLIASLATAPFALYHFGQIALLGILANLIAVPVMGLWVMPWTLISFCFMPFVETSLALDLAAVGIEIIVNIARIVASLPGAILQIGSYPVSVLIWIVTATLWLLIWRNRLKWGALVIALMAVPGLLIHEKPDILFAESGNLYLIKHSEDKIMVSSMRHDRFDRERWQRLYGGTSLTPLKKELLASSIHCDLVGCLYKKGNHRIAFADNWMASDVDCERATILFSTSPIYTSCDFPELVIDKFDLWEFGTHAVYFEGNGRFRVETVNSIRGNRPWVPQRYQNNTDN